MNPDIVRVLANHLCETFRKHHVGPDVRLPQLRIEAPQRIGGHGKDVVQQRPQLTLAEAFVEPLLQLRLQVHGKALIGLQELLRDSLHR